MTGPAKSQKRAASPFSAKNQRHLLSIVQRKAAEGDAQAAAVILLFGVIAGKTPVVGAPRDESSARA